VYIITIVIIIFAVLLSIRVMGMVFNATFNNISVIYVQSVLLVEEPEYQEKCGVVSNLNSRYNNT
jgi:hypothetical protein